MKTKYIAVVSLFILITGVSTTTAALCVDGGCTVLSPTPSSSSNTTSSPAPSPSLENRVTTLEANNYNLSAKLTALESANRLLSARIDTLESTNRSLSARIDALEADNVSLREEVRLLKESVKIVVLKKPTTQTPAIENTSIIGVTIVKKYVRYKNSNDVYDAKTGRHITWKEAMTIWIWNDVQDLPYEYPLK